MNEQTITLNALSLAFLTVKENHGCAGVDGVTVEHYEGNLDLNLKIECSFAYRKGRSVKQAVYMIKAYYEQGYHWVVDADIDAFFDSVDHPLLIKKFKESVRVPFIQTLIELWLKTEIWDGISLTVLQKGIPQGSPISPILANLFLDELDEELLKRDFRLIRYSDDFVILCKKPDEAKHALQLSKQVLEKLLLHLDEEQIISFEQGFKFLGVFFVRSMIMTPFDRPKKERKILSYPKPLNMHEYLINKR